MAKDTDVKSLPYSKSDFVSGQDVRWCPGCGDYSILATMQSTLAKNNFPKENYAFISGIGCSSRFPYYMNTYGFHTIHGRAPTIATGLRAVNPDLSIWIISGDGDGLSIGGNHLIHSMRRNMDINVIFVNNRIYGLTKGQFSPTSDFGQITHTSPMGSISYPVNPLCIAIASESTFIARTADVMPMHMAHVFEEALKHKGSSFIEIYQNCRIFNNHAFDAILAKENRDERTVLLENGKPLTFGKNKEKGIRMKGLNLEIVKLSEVNNEDELLVHEENAKLPTHAYLLTQMTYPEMPVPFGIFRTIEKPTYDHMLDDQVKKSIATNGKGKLKDLIYGSETWKVKRS